MMVVVGGTYSTYIGAVVVAAGKREGRRKGERQLQWVGRLVGRREGCRQPEERWYELANLCSYLGFVQIRTTSMMSCVHIRTCVYPSLSLP